MVHNQLLASHGRTGCFIAARDVEIEPNAGVMSNQSYALLNYQQDWLEISNVPTR